MTCLITVSDVFPSKIHYLLGYTNFDLCLDKPSQVH